MGNGLNTIMLPVRGDGKGDNVLAHAAILAKRHHARVRVIHCVPSAKDLMPYGVVLPRMVREQLEQAAAGGAEVARDELTEEFRGLAKLFGLAEQDYEPNKATARFLQYEGKQVDAVRHYGRLADLICVSQPDPKLNLGANTLKSALFSSGRPVMMCPPQRNSRRRFRRQHCHRLERIAGSLPRRRHGYAIDQRSKIGHHPVHRVNRT